MHDASPDELADWDAWTVEAPGGHVYQSRAWAEHRRRSGWTPRFLVGDDGGRVLALTRAWPAIGGGSAYLPRGPVANASGGAVGATAAREHGAPAATAGSTDPVIVATRQIAVAEALARQGIDVVAADPEIAAADDIFARQIRAAGFRPIEEIQPSRHRVSLALADGTDEDAVFQAIARSTRQRIQSAERDGVVVIRHDTRVRGNDGAGEGFCVPVEPSDIALDRFYDLLLETGTRRRFNFGPRTAFVGWWRAAHGAGHVAYLEARAEDPGGESLAGLVLYRHGGRLSTVHSGDRAAAREDHPGALHLLRWRAIQLAIREGCTEMDLGGVDISGARREPREGEPLYGLYQHKRAFGGRWLELTGAHERVFDPRGYTLGRLAARLDKVVRRGPRRRSVG